MISISSAVFGFIADFSSNSYLLHDAAFLVYSKVRSGGKTYKYAVLMLDDYHG